MIKKIACMCLIALLIPLGGCWSYIGLNEITVVAGIAVDKDPDDNSYQLTFEITDVSKPIKDEGVKVKLVEARGVTLFDAVRNAKKRLSNKLYFGNMQVLIVSKEIAENEEIDGLIDFLLRDAECRETIFVAVSDEPTARELLAVEGLDETAISFKIESILERDSMVTLSTIDSHLYEVYNMTKAQGKSLTLPIFRTVENDDEKAIESNGVAVYKNKKMAGQLSAEDTKYYLFAVDKVKGGVLAFSSTGKGTADTTLEISKNSTKISHTYKNGSIAVIVDTDTTVYLNEMFQPFDSLDKQGIADLESAAASFLESNIARVVKKVQAQYKSDIFGFGNKIYKSNLSLWKEISDKWNQLFPELKVEVHAKISIENTAFVKKN